jgi:VanZ family protein
MSLQIMVRRRRKPMLVFLRALLAVVFVYILWQALAPVPDTPSIIPWDKALHFSAFYVLGGLSAVAFPRMPPLLIFAGLAAYGGAIEGLQAVPAIGRDPEWLDWAADLAGLLTVFAPTLIPEIRRQLLAR